MNASVKQSPGLPGWRAAGLVLLCMLFAALRLPAQVSREYDLKAAFLYNFLTFTDWPADAFSSPESPYVIGVLGADPFGTSLDEMVSGDRVKGRPLVVRRFQRLEDAHRCHILFISASESRRIRDILRRLRGQPILTVSDLPQFAEAGGAIGFTARTRIGLVINPAALHQANLIVSSKLLRLAQLVPPEAAAP